MPEKFKNEYTPDVVSRPGDTLLEILEDRGMSQAELAERMGRPRKTVNEIANGKAEITPETALQLERVLGVPASFWNNLEHNFRDHLARQAEGERISENLAWPGHFPLGHMAALGWITPKEEKADQARALLSFFGVSSIEQWQARYEQEVVAYRLPNSFEPDMHALTAWLRQGEREAQGINCQAFDSGTFKEALQEARALTTEVDPDVFIPKLCNLGARCGVAVVFIRELPRSRACGATRWLNPHKALIQLSLRYKTNDHLWFTFFHECGHIILHGKRDRFVEMKKGSGSKEQEAEADRFSSDLLIPPAAFDALLQVKPFTYEKLSTFARDIGIAPGIVAGRLQHDRHVPFTHFNNLKISYHWVDER